MRQVDDRRVASKLLSVGGFSRGWKLIKPAAALSVIATAFFLFMPSLATATSTGQIAGKVTKASGGAAIEGAEVCAYGASSGEYVNCASTNASGEYTIPGLAAGSYIVEFFPPYGADNYLTQYYDGKATSEEADPVSVTQEETTSNINAAM